MILDLAAEFEEESPLPCPYCAGIMGSGSSLRDHIMRDHPSEVGGKSSPHVAIPHAAKNLEFYKLKIETDPLYFLHPVEERGRKYNLKFDKTQLKYSFRFNEESFTFVRMGFGETLMEHVFSALIQKFKSTVETIERGVCYVGLTLDAPDTLENPIHVPFTRVDQLSHHQLIQQIARVMSSFRELPLDQSLTLEATFIGCRLPNITFGSVSSRSNEWSESFRIMWHRRGLYSCYHAVKPYDCALSALALYEAHESMGKSFYWSSLFRKCRRVVIPSAGGDHARISVEELRREFPVPRRIRNRVLELMQKELFSVFDFNESQGIGLLEAIQKHLDDLIEPKQLIVFDSLEAREPIFSGSIVRPIRSRVYLLCKSEHVWYMSKAEMTMRKSACDSCCAMIPRRGAWAGSHTCARLGVRCRRCGYLGCWMTPKIPGFYITCESCLIVFQSRVCLGNHRNRKCALYRKCVSCGRIMRRNKPGSAELVKHQCLSYSCKHCRKDFQIDAVEPHYCTLQKPREDQLGNSGKFFRCYFDIETAQRGEENRLVPYFLSAVFLCSDCEGDVEAYPSWSKEYPCCGERIRTYAHRKGVGKFLVDLLRPREDGMKRGIAMAYNLRGFDAYFILRILFANAIPVTGLIVVGHRLLSFTCFGVQFKDLNLYVQGRLSELPKSFGISHIIKKGTSS